MLIKIKITVVETDIDFLLTHSVFENAALDYLKILEAI